MKTILDKEQSKELVKFGLEFPYALMIHSGEMLTDHEGSNIPDPKGWYMKIELDDLINILQGEIGSVEEKGTSYPFYMIYQNKKWSVYYGDYIGLQTADELIDAAYKLVVWRLNNHYL